MNEDCKTPTTKLEVHKVLLQCYEQWEESLKDHNDSNSQFQVTVFQEVPSDPEGFAVWLENPSKPGAHTPDSKRTAAAVTVRWWGVQYTDVGFATLNWKSGDTWNSEYGIDMAIKKAIGNLAKQIALGKPPALVITRG